MGTLLALSHLVLDHGANMANRPHRGGDSSPRPRAREECIIRSNYKKVSSLSLLSWWRWSLSSLFTSLFMLSSSSSSSSLLSEPLRQHAVWYGHCY
eukprot:3377558-Amphidinium_carterae.3